MRRLLSAIVLAPLLVGLASAAEERRKPREITGLVEPIPSPDNRLELFYRKEQKNALFNDPYPNHQIWIRSKIDPGKPVLLYSYGRDADVSRSPDSKMVAITDAEGSSSSHVVIFRVSSQLTPEAIKQVELFVQSHQKQMLPEYDHFYAAVVGWAEDSSSLTIELWGDFTEWDMAQTESRTFQCESA